MKYVAHLQYQTTNNEAEYEAFLKGLELAKSLGVESVVVQGDSQLIINQVNVIDIYRLLHPTILFLFGCSVMSNSAIPWTVAF